MPGALGGLGTPSSMHHHFSVILNENTNEHVDILTLRLNSNFCYESHDKPARILGAERADPLTVCCVISYQCIMPY